MNCFICRLPESCSHIGAVLYFIETAVRMCANVTCMMEKSQWLIPARAKKVDSFNICWIVSVFNNYNKLIDSAETSA